MKNYHPIVVTWADSQDNFHVYLGSMCVIPNPTPRHPTRRNKLALTLTKFYDGAFPDDQGWLDPDVSWVTSISRDRRRRYTSLTTFPPAIARPLHAYSTRLEHGIRQAGALNKTYPHPRTKDPKTQSLQTAEGSLSAEKYAHANVTDRLHLNEVHKKSFTDCVQSRSGPRYAPADQAVGRQIQSQSDSIPDRSLCDARPERVSQVVDLANACALSCKLQEANFCTSPRDATCLPTRSTLQRPTCKERETNQLTNSPLTEVPTIQTNLQPNDSTRLDSTPHETSFRINGPKTDHPASAHVSPRAQRATISIVERSQRAAPLHKR